MDVLVFRVFRNFLVEWLKQQEKENGEKQGKRRYITIYRTVTRQTADFAKYRHGRCMFKKIITLLFL